MHPEDGAAAAGFDFSPTMLDGFANRVRALGGARPHGLTVVTLISSRTSFRRLRRQSDHVASLADACQRPPRAAQLARAYVPADAGESLPARVHRLLQARNVLARSPRWPRLERSSPSSLAEFFVDTEPGAAPL